MKSLTYKLACVFIIISIVPLAIGIAGALVLQTAEQALNESNQSLQELSELLDSAGLSLAENLRAQAEANAATSLIAGTQDETYAALKDMGDNMIPKSMAISKMRFAIADVTAAERALLLTLNMRHLEAEELRETRDAQIGNISAALTSLEEGKKAYLALEHDAVENSAWAAFDAALGEWMENHAAFMAEIENLNVLVEDLVRGGPLFASASRKAYDTAFVRGREVREACEQGIEHLNQAIAGTAESDVRKAMEAQTRSRTLVGELDQGADETTRKVNSLQEQIERARLAALQATGRSAEAISQTTARFRYMLIFSALSMAAAISLGLVLSWRISRPVREMAAHMSRLAKGNLTGDVPDAECRRTDEIGQLARAMQEMIDSNRAEIRMADSMAKGDYTRPMPLRSEFDQLGRALGSMVRTTNGMLSQVSQAVDRVGDGAAAVSEASKSLSQGAMTSASALEEISLTVNNVDSQAKENAAHAQKANSLATASRDAARRGYDAVSELVAAMGEIQQSGKKIATVAKLIDDIAFQTNLLALNAAVEAARAGRQGKGFSVVADEVRNLSGRSAKAARETGAMVAAMTERMEAGVQLAARSDNEFREIVDATIQVAQLFEEISGASNAQSSAMAQIAQGLNQIDEVIQENTHNSGRTAASAQTLSRQAEELRSMVSQFRLIADDPSDFETTGSRFQIDGRSPPAIMLDDAGRKLLSASDPE